MITRTQRRWRGPGAIGCAEHLGSLPVAELFRSGHLSAVIGLRLADDREVVVKVRSGSSRIAACVEVQRRMFESGYPCPEPLTGAVPFGDREATGEVYVPGGAILPGVDDGALAFAEAFARLIRLAPRPAEVPSLAPAPSWAAWDQAEAGLWPRPEDSDIDLNEIAGPRWIDDTGCRARDRLRAADSEAVLVGFAAALYSTVSPNDLATIEETERFLDAYCDARGRPFSADELQRSWAAGVWTRAYDAKYQHVVGQPVASLSQSEARERLSRAGTD